ncbi:PREDICTED: lectin subunit alpha-like [Nicrophorus vespilloides]|uniref:Lectin subunit alpha-like n=1 Tax=Nicrophorus vespilloides TaxID=110193 RepID=A0ABM1M100_NICVS|nr:PREDICTED: lectin subunit alpha-like [Nicrophorus vespilloides]
MNLKLLVILLVAFCGSSTSSSVKRSPLQYEFKDKLYYFETFYKASWFKAFMACSKNGMELWSIDSDEEFDKVHKYVKEKMEYKKDLMIWTAGAMKDKGQFYWMNTGNPVRSSRWWPTSPSNYDGRQFCLHIWLTEGKFLLNDFRCDMESYFICESRKI